MKNVILKAEVLISGKGCPICGGNKTEKAKTCRKCLTEIGPVATKAVDEIINKTFEAMIGNAAANSGTVVRGNVWQTPVLANTRIDLDAKFHPAQGDIGAYWQCKRGIPGGYVSIFIFGEDLEAGQDVCGLTDLKVKIVPIEKGSKEKVAVHYLRVQAVDKNIKSDFKLVVLEPQEIERLRQDYLPANKAQTEKFGFAVGFLPVMAKTKHELDAETAASLG